MSNRLPWLRLYTRVIDDDKLLLLDEADRWRYIGILALKREGVLDEPCAGKKLRRMAVRLRLSVDDVKATMERLIDADLIDEDGNPLAWDRLQFSSDVDSTAAERKRRQRARQRSSGGAK